MDAKILGLDLPPMRNGRPRRASLMWVGIRYGVPGYCVEIEGRGQRWLDTLPALQDYFAPIWPEHHLLARRRYAYTYTWPEACLGCGLENGCSLHGCAAIRKAAALLRQ